MERGGLGYIIIAIEVEPDQMVPVDRAHLGKDAIAQNAGIVHHRVELAEGAQGIFDDAGGSGGVRNICGVDDRLTARGADFRDDLLGGPGVAAFAVLRAAQIIHDDGRSEEHTSELQSPMRISYAVFCLKKKKKRNKNKLHN